MSNAHVKENKNSRKTMRSERKVIRSTMFLSEIYFLFFDGFVNVYKGF